MHSQHQQGSPPCLEDTPSTASCIPGVPAPTPCVRSTGGGATRGRLPAASAGLGRRSPPPRCGIWFHPPRAWIAAGRRIPRELERQCRPPSRWAPRGRAPARWQNPCPRTSPCRVPGKAAPRTCFAHGQSPPDARRLLLSSGSDVKHVCRTRQKSFCVVVNLFMASGTLRCWSPK